MRVCRAGIGLTVLLTAALASAAHVDLAWQNHSTDGLRTMEMKVGEQAIIEVWIRLVDGDSLSTVIFSNEEVTNLKQAAAVTAIDGWADGSTAGENLGDVGQQISWAVADPNQSIDTAGDYLIGTVTVELTDAGDGSDLEIAFKESTVRLFSKSANAFSLVASDSAFIENAGFFGLGGGSPGYTDSIGIVDTRDPLIVKVVGDTDTNGTNPGPVTDTDGDGVSDDQDAFPNDPGETTDTDNDGTGDNADTDDDGDGTVDTEDDFPTDPTETIDTDNDGIGNNEDTDDDNDGTVDEEDSTPLGEDTSNGSTANGPCGVGVVTSTPIIMLGILLMGWGNRRK